MPAYPPVDDRDDVQRAVDLDQLDQPGVAKGGDQLVHVELLCLRRSAALSPQGASPYGVFESAPFTVECDDSVPTRSALLVVHARDCPQRRQLCDPFLVVRRRYEPVSKCCGAPTFGPGKEQARTVSAQGFPLRDHGKLCAVRRGIGTQLGRPKGRLVLVQCVQATSTRCQRRARVARGFTTQRLSEPANAAVQRGA